MTRSIVGLALGGIWVVFAGAGCPATQGSGGNGNGSANGGDGGVGAAAGGAGGSGGLGGTAVGGSGGVGGLGGSGGLGGAAGGTGGGGGTGPCFTCSEYQTDCINNPPCPGGNEICGASQVVFNSWRNCICGECPTQCTLTCTGSGQDLVPDCATCKTTANSGTCTPHYAACLNDT